MKYCYASANSERLILGVIALWFLGLVRPFPLVSVAEAVLLCIFVFELIRTGFRKQLFSSNERFLLLGIMSWFVILILSALYSGAFAGEGLVEVWSWRKALTCFVVAFYLVRFSRVYSIFEAMFFFSVCMSAVLVVLTAFGVEVSRSTQAVIENHTTQPIILTWFFVPFYYSMLKQRMFASGDGFRLSLFFMLLFLATFYVSQGRGGYLYFIVVGLTLLADYFSRNPHELRRVIFPAVIGLLVIALISGILVKDRVIGAYEEFVYAYDPVFDSKGASVSIRRHMWGITLDMIWDKPWFGTGAGQFAPEYLSRVENMPGWLARPTDDPHNSYLHIGAEHGLLALSIFMAAVGSCIYVSLFCIKGAANRVFGALALGFLATSFTSGHFNTFVEGRLFFLSLYLALMMPPETIEVVKS